MKRLITHCSFYTNFCICFSGSVFEDVIVMYCREPPQTQKKQKYTLNHCNPTLFNFSSTGWSEIINEQPKLYSQMTLAFSIFFIFNSENLMSCRLAIFSIRGSDEQESRSRLDCVQSWELLQICSDFVLEISKKNLTYFTTNIKSTFTFRLL